MVYQSLVLGILFSIGIFAVKSGVGFSYFLSGHGKRREKVLAFLLFETIYLYVFYIAAFIIDKIDTASHLTAVMTFIKSGIVVHLTMAALLMIWGLVLLRKNDGFRNDSKGWLMLAIPCPVCMIVILFSVGFLITLFPDAPGSVAVVFYLAFLLINLLTMGAIYFYRKTSTISPEYLLGGAMMLIAAYFFLSVTIIPQFDDVEKVYRLAMYKGRMQPAETLHLIPFSILIISAFIGGYGLKFKKIRSTIS